MQQRAYKTILAVSLAVLAGCGSKVGHVEAELVPYVQEFQRQSQVFNKSTTVTEVTVVFGDVPTITGNVVAIGVCDFGSKTVTVDSKTWKTLSDESKQTLVTHELGHCALSRLHRTDMVSNTGCAQSLMNPYIVSDYCANVLENEYSYEMFHEGAIVQSFDMTYGSSPKGLTRGRIID